MEFDWGVAATAACGLLTGVGVPAAGWALSTINDLRDRVTRLEAKHEALEGVVSKALLDVNTSVAKLADKLDAHMSAEAADIERSVERALTRVLREERGGESSANIQRGRD